MRNTGKHRATCRIELDEVKEENVYEEMDKKRVKEEIYDDLETDRKTQADNTSKGEMDKTKVVIAVLSVVVTALVVAVVAVTSIVYFGATDGGWTGWEDWGACSVTCGVGFTTRIRTCSNPRPSIIGHFCDGTAVQVKACNNNSCSVTDSKWTSWGDWGACSVTCGGGLITRSRTCSNPRPSTMREYCDGTSEQMKICNNIPCSVTDGGWTSWGDWGTCSVTCGGGLIARSRTCSNPRPSSIGKYCESTSEQMKICNVIPCSVTDGKWTSWGDWGVCSVSCGGGLITRSRRCSNPQPSTMREYCDGTSEQMKICNNIPCSVTDGGWTSWGNWGTCSVTCGSGLISRSRTCSNPRPSSIGKYCDGTSEQMKICNNIPCSVTDGGWTSWGNWGTCSVTCGSGLISRSRTCSNPRPSSIGKYCEGASEQMKICNVIPCSAEPSSSTLATTNKNTLWTSSSTTTTKLTQSSKPHYATTTTPLVDHTTVGVIPTTVIGGYSVLAIFGQDMVTYVRLNKTRVVRGRDWKWNDQDGHGMGTILRWDSTQPWVYVKWDNGMTNSYRMGAQGGKYDLYIVSI